jgi:hypothetical protein
LQYASIHESVRFANLAPASHRGDETAVHLS